MKKNMLLGCAMAAVLGVTLTACNGNAPADNKADDKGGDAKQEQKADEGFDAVEAYYGQWRGSVEITGQTVYGTAGGNEAMLDVNLNEDGTCEVVPLEAHADLLTDEGTWEGTEEEIVLHLSSKDIVLTVVDSAKCEADAAEFDIADFDVLNFDFFG